MRYSRHRLTASVTTRLRARTRQLMKTGFAMLVHWSVRQKLNLVSSVQFSLVTSLCTRLISFVCDDRRKRTSIERSMTTSVRTSDIIYHCSSWQENIASKTNDEKCQPTVEMWNMCILSQPFICHRWLIRFQRWLHQLTDHSLYSKILFTERQRCCNHSYKSKYSLPYFKHIYIYL